MDRKIESEELIRAAEELEKLDAKNRQKRELCLWQDEINLHISLGEVLARLKKNELDDIRRTLELKNMSSLKKQDLANQLARLLPEKSKATFKLFDEERYNLTKKIAQNGGYLYQDDLCLEQAEYFRRHGIFFTGISDDKRVLVMPAEILESFKETESLELIRIVKRNTQWISLTQGLLYYYGVLSTNQLEEMICKYTNEKKPNPMFIEVLLNSIEYNERIEPFSQGFQDFRVFDADALYLEHQTRSDLEYHSFTKEQLLWASEEDFADWTSAFKHLVEWIQNNYEVSKKDAAAITRECSEIFQEGGEVPEVMEYLNTELDIDTFGAVQALTKELVYLFNNTRKWELKGHTPHELSRSSGRNLKPAISIPLAEQTASAEVIDIKTRKKVGRNDPCPCGSGKKFKKCCGK